MVKTTENRRLFTRILHSFPDLFDSILVYSFSESKRNFKKEWAGLRDEALQKASGIKTAHFCHKKLFLATAATKEDALKFIEETKKGY